jgi:SAM-dependent methyltransferase
MNRDYFETRFHFDNDRKIVWKAISEYLQQFINENDTVLELGAGYCDFINQVKAGKKIATDLNPDVAGFCNKDVMFLHGAAGEHLHAANESIDVVFASNFFEHLTDSASSGLLRELTRILKPGGKIILMQPNYYYSYREYWDDYTHVKAFSHVSLQDYLNSFGFKTIHLEKKFIPFSLKSRLPKSYFLTKLYLSFPVRPFAKQMLIVVKK